MGNQSWRDRNDSDFELHDPAPSESIRPESRPMDRFDCLEAKFAQTDKRITALRTIAVVSAVFAATVFLALLPAEWEHRRELAALRAELQETTESIRILRDEVQELKSVLLQRGAEDLAGAAAVAPLRPSEGTMALRILERDDDYGVPVVAVHHGRVVSIQDEGQVIPGSKKGVHWGVAIEHTYGSLMRYGRLSDIADDLAVGKTIRKGQAIGTVSPT